MKQYRTLIAEDEPLMREYLRQNLHSIHSQFLAADCARDGLDALRMLNENHYDLLITDIKMPGMDGITLVEKMRESNKQIPVILLTGYDEFEYARAGLRLGVAEYLLKPLNDMELGECLERLKTRLESEKTIVLPAEWTPETIQSFISDCFANGNTEQSLLAKRAATYISEHFTEQITQTDVAEALGVSSAYLSSIFHETTGESYSKFLTRLRMTQAAILLKADPSLTLQRVAELTGYVSDKHFINVFKRFFQMTPNEYRKDAQQLHKTD